MICFVVLFVFFVCLLLYLLLYIWFVDFCFSFILIVCIVVDFGCLLINCCGCWFCLRALFDLIVPCVGILFLRCLIVKCLWVYLTIWFILLGTNFVFTFIECLIWMWLLTCAVVAFYWLEVYWIAVWVYVFRYCCFGFYLFIYLY